MEGLNLTVALLVLGAMAYSPKANANQNLDLKLPELTSGIKHYEL